MTSGWSVELEGFVDLMTGDSDILCNLLTDTEDCITMPQKGDLVHIELGEINDQGEVPSMKDLEEMYLSKRGEPLSADAIEKLEDDGIVIECKIVNVGVALDIETFVYDFHQLRGKEVKFLPTTNLERLRVRYTNDVSRRIFYSSPVLELYLEPIKSS
jgi:hypothetical protein